MAAAIKTKPLATSEKMTRVSIQLLKLYSNNDVDFVCAASSTDTDSEDTDNIFARRVREGFIRAIKRENVRFPEALCNRLGDMAEAQVLRRLSQNVPAKAYTKISSSLPRPDDDRVIEWPLEDGDTRLSPQIQFITPAEDQKTQKLIDSMMKSKKAK